MAQYDPKIIYQFADRLYARANSIVAKYLLLAGLLGAAIGYVIDVLARSNQFTLTIAFAVLGAIFGALGGADKAFRLKLRLRWPFAKLRSNRIRGRAKRQVASHSSFRRLPHHIRNRIQAGHDISHPVPSRIVPWSIERSLCRLRN